MDRRRSREVAIIALVLAATGCARPTEEARNIDSLDNELIDATSANSRDPAMMAALHDQIMVDPALAQQSNNYTVRPPAQPYSGATPPDDVAAPAGTAPAVATATSETMVAAPEPKTDCPQCTAARNALTLGALAGRQADQRTSSCAADMRYSAGWATRLSPDLPLYPDARISEAAGAGTNGCTLRAVSFATAAPMKTVIDWYYTRAKNAGFAADHAVNGPQHMLGGTRTRDGAAFTLFLTARKDGGTDIDLVANNGV